MAGWLVDYLKSHRNAVLKISSFYGFALYAACAVSVIYSKNVWNWLVLLCLYSPLRSLQLSAVDTIFADSTVTGNRVAAFTARQNTVAQTYSSHAHTHKKGRTKRGRGNCYL